MEVHQLVEDDKTCRIQKGFDAFMTKAVSTKSAADRRRAKLQTSASGVLWHTALYKFDNNYYLYY